MALIDVRIRKIGTLGHYSSANGTGQILSTRPSSIAPSGLRPARVEFVTIDDAHAGQRLDNFLIRVLKGVPKTHIYRLVRKGEVRINKGRSAADYRLQVGDVVRIPPVRTAANQTQRLAADPGSEQRFAWLETHILFEDDWLIAVDKPAGLATHGGSGVSVGLIEALRLARPHARYLELVHRLDRDTSGCLLVAKKRSALTALHAMFREDGMDKRYLALVRGTWKGGHRTVDAPLEKTQSQTGDRQVNVTDGGKLSKSILRPERKFAAATLLEIRLLTGRTHQARVHCAYIDHPIAGDDKYGDRDFNRSLRAHGLERLFLHAHRLQFRHPQTQAKIDINAPLPAELGEVLSRLP